MKFPIRDLEREQNSAGSGPVTTRRMTAEEMEDHFARTAPSRPTDVEGKPISPPVIQSDKEGVQSKVEQKKREFLINFAGSSSVTAQAIEEKVTGLNALNAQKEIERMEQRMVEAQQQATKAWSEVEELRERIVGYESELARWAQVDGEKDLLTAELLEDSATWKRIAANDQKELKAALDRIEELQKDRDSAEMEARQAITELEEERQLLLETIERAASIKPDDDKCGSVETEVDNVNSPPHYTAGGIETIDFIQAKLTPEEFAGYCKGNALKYVSRANHKGGMESMQKAGWYVNRLIDGVAK